MIFTQALHVFVEGSSVKRYNAGTWAGLSCLVLILASSFDAYYRVALHDGVSIHAVFLAFTASEIILGIVIFVLAISIQRRPDVFKDGQLVDAQYTGSAFQRSVVQSHTYFSWTVALKRLDTHLDGLGLF